MKEMSVSVKCKARGSQRVVLLRPDLIILLNPRELRLPPCVCVATLGVPSGGSAEMETVQAGHDFSLARRSL